MTANLVLAVLSDLDLGLADDLQLLEVVDPVRVELRALRVPVLPDRAASQRGAGLLKVVSLLRGAEVAGAVQVVSEDPPLERGAPGPGGRVVVLDEETLERGGDRVAGVPVVDVEHQPRAAHGQRADRQQRGQVHRWTDTGEWASR